MRWDSSVWAVWAQPSRLECAMRVRASWRGTAVGGRLSTVCLLAARRVSSARLRRLRRPCRFRCWPMTALRRQCSVENIGTTGAARIHVNMASVSPEMADLLARRFADADVTYVAAPVLGRPEAAAAGRLSVLEAGPQSALDEVEPFLASCSARRWRLGELPRQANATKIAMNLMLLNALESMGESIALVEAEGVLATDFVELFTHSFFGGVIHTVYGEIIAERRYSPPGFTVALGLKDLGLAERLAAQTHVDLAMAPVLRSRFEAALEDPQLADLDWSAIAEISRTSRVHPAHLRA